MASSRLGPNELVQLLVKDFANDFGGPQSRRTLTKLLVLAVRFHTEFLIDGLKLLHEIILALTLGDFAVEVTRKFALQLRIDEFLF
jgi:hypothetical protein